MQGYDQSIADVIRSTIHDAQDLVRGEIALAKAELREEIRRMRTGAAALAVAAVSALVAVIFLLTAAAWGISAAFGWSAWTGFAIVGMAVLMVGVILGITGKNQFNGERHMPLTVDTMKENLEWTRARKP